MAEAAQEFLARYAERRDAEAFRELVELHQDMVYAACNRVLGNAADAEDAAQNCFLSLARKPEQVKKSVAGWLHRAAVHAALDLARQERSRRKREVLAMEKKPAPASSSWNDVAEAVDEAIDDLPDDLRIPVIRYYLERRTQEDIARELEVTHSAISKRLQRGVAALRGRLAKAGFVTPAAVLGTLLLTNAADAAPVTLIAALGKMALAGGSGATVGGTAAEGAAAATTGGLAMKATVSILVASALIAGGVAVHNGYSQKQNPPPTAVGAPQVASSADAANLPAPAGAFELLEGAYLRGEYDMVEEAFRKGEYDGKPLVMDYPLARLRARNALGRYRRYGYDRVAAKGGWPNADEAVVYRRLARECTTAFEEAFRLAPSRFDRGQLYALWHEVSCRGYFDADSELMRSGSPLVQQLDEVELKRLDAQTAAFREAVLKGLDGNDHARQLAPEARGKFADVFSEEFRKVASIGVPDNVFAELLRDVPEYLRVNVHDSWLDNPDKKRLGLEHHIWCALTVPGPDRIERQVLDARAREYADSIHEKVDLAIENDVLFPGGHPRCSEWFLEVYETHKDNRFFPVFREATPPQEWDRSTAHFKKEVLPLADLLKAALQEYEKELAELETNPKYRKSRSGQELKDMKLRQITKNRSERTSTLLSFCRSDATRTFNGFRLHCLRSQVPGMAVWGLDGSPTPSDMSPWNAVDARPIGAFPVRQAVTSEESTAMTEEKASREE